MCKYYLFIHYETSKVEDKDVHIEASIVIENNIKKFKDAVNLKYQEGDLLIQTKRILRYTDIIKDLIELGESVKDRQYSLIDKLVKQKRSNN